MRSGKWIPTSSIHSTRPYDVIDKVEQSRKDLSVVLFAVCMYFSQCHRAKANNLQRAARNKDLNGGLSFGRVVHGVRL